MVRYMDVPSIRCFTSAPTWTCFSCDVLRSITMRPCIHVDASWRNPTLRMENASVLGRPVRFGSVKFGAKASSMSRHLHILVHHFSRITRRHQTHQGITDNGLFHPHVEIQWDRSVFMAFQFFSARCRNEWRAPTDHQHHFPPLSHKFLTGLVQLLQAQEIVLGKCHILYQQNIWSFVDDQTVISSCIKTQFIPDKFMNQSRSPSFIISQSLSNDSVGAFWVMLHAHTFLRKIIRYFGIEAEFSSMGIG